MASQIETRKQFVAEFLSTQPESASVVLGKMDESELCSVMNSFSPDTLASALNLLPPAELADALLLMNDVTVMEIVKKLGVNIVASIVRTWKGGGENTRESRKANLVLSSSDAKFVKAVKNLLLYPNGTVGSLMNPVPFVVTDGITVGELLALLKRERHRYSRYVYIIDDVGKLSGVLPFKEAFYADEQTILAQLATSKVTSIKPEVSARKALAKSVWRKWDSLPVVDADNVILGVIREDVLDAYVENTPEKEEDNTEILKAASAVGEVLQIALTGTASAFGIDPRKNSKKK